MLKVKIDNEIVNTPKFSYYIPVIDIRLYINYASIYRKKQKFMYGKMCRGKFFKREDIFQKCSTKMKDYDMNYSKIFFDPLPNEWNENENLKMGSN